MLNSTRGNNLHIDANPAKSSLKFEQLSHKKINNTHKDYHTNTLKQAQSHDCVVLGKCQFRQVLQNRGHLLEILLLTKPNLKHFALNIKSSH